MNFLKGYGVVTTNTRLGVWSDLGLAIGKTFSCITLTFITCGDCLRRADVKGLLTQLQESLCIG